MSAIQNPQFSQHSPQLSLQVTRCEYLNQMRQNRAKVSSVNQGKVAEQGRVKFGSHLSMNNIYSQIKFSKWHLNMFMLQSLYLYRLSICKFLLSIVVDLKIVCALCNFNRPRNFALVDGS